MPARFGLEKGMTIFSMRAPYLGAGIKLTRTSPRTRPSVNAVVQSLATRRKNAATPVDVTQTVPTKHQIKQYCLKDAEFASLYALARTNGPGASRATTQLRSVRERVLRDLPFGPILPTKG